MDTQQLTDWLEAATAQLHTQHASSRQRKEAEAALLQFQRSDAAWTFCLQLLAQTQAAASPQLLLFAAQTLRAKINDEGSKLPQQHLEQLRHSLLHQLTQPGLPSAILRHLCLGISTLAALLPDQQGWLQPVCHGSTLPWQHASNLLHALAEEGCSDWRHVTVPGLTSSEKLSWATATRDRFRCWSEDALALLLTWLQQQQQQQPIVCLLESLTAWVKLGSLHNVPEQLSEAVVNAGLVHIQSAEEEVVSAALGLLTEVCEYSPEQLLQALQPHMLQVATAAVQAAVVTPPDLMHAAAWVSAFSAYAAAVPQQVLAEEEEGATQGQSLRHALLQVASLPHLHSTQPVCTPAVHVWSTLLGQDTAAASTARFAAAGYASGGLSRASTGVEEATADLVPAEDSEDTPAGAAAAAVAKVPACMQRTCHQLLLHAAWNCMLWRQTAEGREALASVEVQAAVHELFLAISCVLGQQQYLRCVLHVWAGQGPLVLAHTPSSTQQQLPIPALQQQQQLSEAIAAAPAHLRLQVAVDMAAAAAVQQRLLQAAEASTDSSLAQSSIAGLLSHAAASVSQSPGQPNVDHGNLVHSFCMAVQVWATHLAHHFASSPADQGPADMLSLLQLLLAISSSTQEDPGGHMRAAAAAAVRALTSAALHAGWDKLYMGAPLLLKAEQQLAGMDSADQALFAGLAMCLAASPAVGAPQEHLQELRSRSVKQLVQPAVHHLQQLLQQLHSGVQWSTLGKPADSCLCQHLVRVRVVLEAAWQRHEQQRKQASAGHLQGVELGQHKEPSQCVDGPMFPSAALLLQHDMDDDSVKGAADGWQEAYGPSPWPAADVEQSSGAADLGNDPAVQLVLESLWGQLHALVVRHGACGKFLQHYAKCCSKLLKLQPLLLLRPAQQRAQFLDVCVLGLGRPGGCGLAEPLLAAVELCCEQQQTGAPLLLESAPCINQAYMQLWSLPEVLSLRQSRQGDSQPDLAEAVLKLSAAYARCMSILQPSSSQAAAILPNMIAAASACAGCCHKKTGSSALNMLIAVLTGAGPLALLLQQVVAQHGALIAFGAFSALLVPSPLPRLQKVSSVLLELAAFAARVEHSSTAAAQRGSHAGGVNGFAAALASGSTNRQRGAEQSGLYSWLSQATQGFVPAALSAQEAADLAAACAGLLCSSATRQADADSASCAAGGLRARQVPASRSFAAARRLKKRLRDFAEKHMRKSHSAVAH